MDFDVGSYVDVVGLAGGAEGIVVNGPVGVVEEVDVDVDVGVSVGFVVVVDAVEKIVAELAVVEHE